MDDSLIPLLMDHVFWAFLLAFPTGHLASPSGAQATRPRACKAEPFLSNPKLASLLQYSCASDVTRHATPEPSPTSPLDPPHALSGQGSLVPLQDALFICPLLCFYPGSGCYESSLKAYNILWPWVHILPPSCSLCNRIVVRHPDVQNLSIYSCHKYYWTVTTHQALF